MKTIFTGVVIGVGLSFSAVSADQTGPFASFAGASEAVFSDPHDLEFGPDGMLYVADRAADRVVVMDPDTFEITEIIGEGTLLQPHDVSVGHNNQMYVASAGLHGVVLYDLNQEDRKNEGMLGPFPSTAGTLAHSNGNLYVMASGEGWLYAIDAGRTVVAAEGGLIGAQDVTEAPDGSIWVADQLQRRLVQYTQGLEVMRVLDGPEYGFVGPRYLDFTEDGSLVVADQDAHKITKIDTYSGEVMGVIGDGAPGLGPNLLDDPEGVAVRGMEYFFADSDNNRIVKYVIAMF